MMNNDGKQYTVLIVDDMSINIQILSGFLKTDYHIKVASTGKKALEVVASPNPPDLILLDVVMPEVNGFEICRRLKNDEKTKEIPVIFITVLADVENKVKGFTAGGADYVTKPFQREEVLARVQTHLKIKEQNSRLQQQAAELNHARNIAEQANKAKSEFLANVSHEIRTPMNAILGFSEILLKETENPVHRHRLQNIRSAGKVLTALIDDILDLSKVEAGKLEICSEPMNFRDILNEINQLFSHKFREKGLYFKTSVSEDIPDMLILDELRIRQILINLVGNAIKFTHRGYVEVRVRGQRSEVRGQSPRLEPRTSNPEPLTLIIEVRDTGIGIPDDYREKIFESFCQQNGQISRQYGGTGLGLTITRKLAELMNGEVSVESEVGKGSMFKVALHGVETVSSLSYTSPAERTPLPQEETDVEFEPASVLLVDDVASNRELLKAYLEDAPFSIIEAENGDEALAVLGARLSEVSEDLQKPACLPDMILTDMKMPGKDGYELAVIIKNNDKLKQIPVIVLSASAMKETEDKLKGLCEGYIRKPFGKPELIAELKKYLPHRAKKYSPKDTEKDIAAETAYIKECCPEMTARLPELIHALEDELAPKWEEIRETLIFDELGDFAEQVKAQGLKYECRLLRHWGEKMLSYIEAFNIEELSGTFQTFPNLIAEIRKIKAVQPLPDGK